MTPASTALTDIHFRLATEEDCDALAHLIESVIQAIPYYNDLAKRDEIEKFQARSLKAKINEDKFSVIVAISAEKIIGFCLSRFDDYLIWLEWFGVLESERGRGIANLLLQELEKTVSARNCHKIWCDCRTGNLASIHILTGNGFNQIATLTNHWYQQDFILWEKAYASVASRPVL